MNSIERDFANATMIVVGDKKRVNNLVASANRHNLTRGDGNYMITFTSKSRNKEEQKLAFVFSSKFVTNSQVKRLDGIIRQRASRERKQK